jgi:hypothetical protein
MLSATEKRCGGMYLGKILGAGGIFGYPAWRRCPLPHGHLSIPCGDVEKFKSDHDRLGPRAAHVVAPGQQALFS